MFRIFLASHAHLASGMKSSIALFAHADGKLTTYDAYVDDAEGGLRAALDEFLDSLEEDEDALLLSDLFGGSVNNTMAEYTLRPHTRLVAGVNLALLLELMALDALDDDLSNVIDRARESMREVVVDSAPAPFNDEDFF